MTTTLYIPIAGNKTYNRTIYTRLGGITGSIIENIVKWTAGDFATVSAVYVEAILYGAGANTAYLKLDNLAASSALGEVSTSNSTPTVCTSGDIKASLSDGVEYTAYIKSGTNLSNMTVVCAWLKVVVDITNNGSKLKTYNPINCYGFSTASAGWAENTVQKTLHRSGDIYFYETTPAVKHVATLKHTNDTDMQSSVYDDGTRDTGADVTTTDTTQDYQESGAITPADNSACGQGYDLGSAGFFISGQIGSSGLNVYVTGLGAAAATRRIFIT
jgi:hypothetical protein